MLDHAYLKRILHYDPETGVFTWLVRRKGKIRADRTAGTPDKDGYIEIGIDRRRYKAHRLAWFYMTGEWPKLFVDHINGITSDNRFANLREATNSQNLHNMGRPRKGRAVRGASYNKLRRKWYAYIRAGGEKPLYLGCFDSEAEAADAYAKAAVELFGEFATPVSPAQN